jgi:octaprenyl-diphosphate synthase
MDYTSSSTEMGKNVGDDLAEGKPTLPLIQAIKVAEPAQAQLIKEAIQHGGLQHLDEILDIVKQTGALDYCLQRAQEESQKAIDSLADVPESTYKRALIGLAQLALKRTA